MRFDRAVHIAVRGGVRRYHSGAPLLACLRQAWHRVWFLVRYC